MNHSDIAALMKGVAPVIRDYLAGAVQPLVDKIAELEGRLNALPKAVEPAEIERRIEAVAADLKASAETAKAEGKEKRKAALADLKAGILAECDTMVAGKAVGPLLARIGELEAQVREFLEPGPTTEEDIRRIIREAIAALPQPEPQPDFAEFFEARMGEQRAFLLKDFRAVIPPAPELPDIPALIAEAVDAIPAPQDGKDADPEQVAALVRQEAERILGGWERPRDGIDGKSVTLEDVSLVAQTMISTRWAEFVRDVALPHDGKDGVGLAGMLIDREGHLVATMTDGSTRNLGPVVGKDGDPGKNGEPGKAGADGVGFDDLDLVETEAGVFLRCIKGETVKEWRLPIVIDRGVFKEGQTYRKGDGVTYGGHYWIAQGETVEKPDTGKGWRMAVRKGRDGKDGEIKPPRDPKPVKVG